MAYKTFVTGDILTANDANNQFMKQTIAVFATAAARTSALASPVEGQYSYLEDSDSTWIYNGSNWVVPTNSMGAGSTLISSTTISSAAFVSVNNCFTSTYDAYQIVLNVTGITGTNKMFMRLSGTDSVTGYYDAKIVTSGAAGTTVTGSVQSSVATGWMVFQQAGQNTALSGTVIVTNPATTALTNYSALPIWYNNSGPTQGLHIASGTHSSAVAYDGFTFTFAGAVNGTVKVYGLKN